MAEKSLNIQSELAQQSFLTQHKMGSTSNKIVSIITISSMFFSEIDLQHIENIKPSIIQFAASIVFEFQY